MQTPVNTVSMASRTGGSPPAATPPLAVPPRPSSPALGSDVYPAATAATPQGGAVAAGSGGFVAVLSSLIRFFERLLMRLDAALQPAPAVAPPAAVVAPVAPVLAPAAPTPSVAPVPVRPAPPAVPARPVAPSTPAPTTGPAAPAGTKPPLLQQFIRKGDPSTGVYGASGAEWYGDANVDDVKRVISEAKAQNQTPVFVQYNIPNRDKGGGSAGGAATVEAYAASCEKNAAAIGDAPAVVIIEPDALALGLDPSTVKRALEIYRAHCPNARLYLDAGNCAWLSVDDAANKLLQAGIKEADGFSLNVSGFQWTNDSTAYGDKIVAALAQRDPSLASKQFVVDTSRNGNGTGVDENGHDTWGDPVRAKNGGPIMNGPLPTTHTGDPHCAAFLWVKPPGFGDLRTRSCFQFGGAAWVAPNPHPPLGPTGHQ